MTEYKTICFLISCLLLQAAYCQDRIVTQTSYAAPPMQEKVYVRTDKTVYVAGEILWFALYNINTTNNHLSDLSKIAYVELIDTLHKPVMQAKVALDNGLGNGSLGLLPALSSGNYKLRVYTSWMKNGSAGNFFEKDITVINVQKLTIGKKEGIVTLRPSTADRNRDYNLQTGAADSNKLSLMMSGDKTIYQARDKVTLSVEATGMKSNDSAFASISVYRIDSLQPLDAGSVSNYLLPAPDNGTGKSNASFLFAPEYNGHVITGKVLGRNGEPESGAMVYLSIPGNSTQFYPSVSDSSGLIRWETKAFYGASRLILQTQQDSSYSIRIDDPFSQSFSSSIFPPFTLPYDCPNTLAEHSISMQVPHIYSETKLEQYQVPVYDTVPFYGVAGKTYYLDDFVRFNTLEEVMREYVALANVTKRRGDFHLPVFDEETQKMFTSDPLILLDGVPFFDINRFMALDPRKIRKLDVVFHRFFYGSAMFDGILNWHSYDGELAEASLSPAAITTDYDYDGLSMRRDFYSPNYETEEQHNSHLPDFRNVLYWNPNVVLKNKQPLSFYTSDLPGTYAVVVQSISQSGITSSRTMMFEVRK